VHTVIKTYFSAGYFSLLITHVAIFKKTFQLLKEESKKKDEKGAFRRFLLKIST
jgi:hypothetical protein